LPLARIADSVATRPVPWDHSGRPGAKTNELTMTGMQIDHDDLNAALRRCGSSWNAGQAHGFLCSHLALDGAEGAARWRVQVLADADPDNQYRPECESLLEALCNTTWQQLAERQSDFAPLLPDDDSPTALRAEALGQWCEGFLHGLVSAAHGDALRERLASDPLSDIIRDLVEITRATAGDEASDEDNENAWVELVEYLRVAAQLTYEELAEFRDALDCAPRPGPQTLH
jgi:hypothetical protein